MCKKCREFVRSPEAFLAEAEVFDLVMTIVSTQRRLDSFALIEVKVILDECSRILRGADRG